VLITPPYQSVSHVLAEHLSRQPRYGRFACTVAWARASGVAQIGEELAQFSGSSLAIVGVDFGQTSYEGVLALWHLMDDLYLFRTATAQTFHPKLYAFLPAPDDEHQQAACLIGSCNATYGGFDLNFEAAWLETLNLNNAADRADYEDILAYLARLQAEPGCVRIESQDMLEHLREEGDLPLERDTRAARRSSPDAALPSERPRSNPSERRAVVRPQRPPRSVVSLGTLLGFAPQTEPTEIEELSDAMEQPAPEAVTVPETGDLRVEQAAAYLSARLGWDISPAMLRNWRWRGHFPRSYKDGNARASPIYFVREELDSFVPPVAERWAVGKPKYTTEEERAAAEEAVRQRARAKRRAQPPDGYISQEEALSQLGFSRQRLHILVHQGDIRTEPPVEERAESAQRHWRVWYSLADVQAVAARRSGDTE
jgi:hypothetical protein